VSLYPHFDPCLVGERNEEIKREVHLCGSRSDRESIADREVRASLPLPRGARCRCCAWRISRGNDRCHDVRLSKRST
jgi:hypothetical protein